ncbi:aminoglycoside phosphotransferase family protein [Streptomyces kunmingensis]|uniref:Aminoglycoside phosphotransferase family protein n=1 Tax=Streptomyces kunmingensis TaxID=68225 RepID=A0ABU6CHS7_9ACTN|nr:phosphotransferase [Streptomyces kunmingensis]MEB3963756.1 aminoglycoside phosphotransferase family protein [Streptomyces kunmingensis]
MSTSIASAFHIAVRGTLHEGPAARCGGCVAVTLADRPDGTVVRHGDTVAKAHAPDTDAAELRLRLAVAAHPALAGVLLPPLRDAATPLDGRLVTFWPHGTPVDPDHPENAPWEAAAALLARLHATPLRGLPPGLPPMRGPVKAARALARLRAAAPDHPAARPVGQAWRTLPPWARAEAPYDHARALCHGDLHLGQLVRGRAGSGPWLLIDVDDLGLGDPAWDLARPAAWFACGLLPADDWARFLAAYRSAGGAPQLSAADPWPALDVPARALTVQTAALAVAKATEAGRPLDEVEVAVVDACDRMAGIPAQLGSAAAK